MTTFKRTPVELRFLKYVVKTESGCWKWTGATTFGGYGVLNSGGQNGKIVRAHRLSWCIYNGRDIPDGLKVCHRCDNPPCCNPDHLFLGTQVDNMSDCANKGRSRKGKDGMKGEAHHRAKLTDEQVIAIRAEYAAGGIGFGKLAIKHGVSKKTVLNIVHRASWTHV